VKSLGYAFLWVAALGCSASDRPAMQRALDVYAPGMEATSRADGDFNGDGMTDRALYGHDKSRELLIVLLSGPGATYRVVPIQERPLSPSPGTEISLKTHAAGPLVIPGEFKKLLDPKPPDRLEHEAIDVLYGNEAGEVCYWDGERFVTVPTGD
jgi:hypothetical protein